MFLLRSQLQNYFVIWVYLLHCFFFPLSALKFILKIFNHTMMYLCVFFVFIYLSHLGFLAHLKSVGLKIFTSFRKISAIICLYITSVSFSFSPLARTPIMYMSNHLTVFCMSFTLCSIFSFFSVCVSIWIYFYSLVLVTNPVFFPPFVKSTINIENFYILYCSVLECVFDSYL